MVQPLRAFTPVRRVTYEGRGTVSASLTGFNVERRYEEIMQAHHARRVVLNVERRGNVVAPRAILDALPRAAFKVRDWRGGRSPKTVDATLKVAIELGAACEVQYDAAHGRRYRLLVFMPADRSAIIGFGTRPGED